jgi:hypothetical protein
MRVLRPRSVLAALALALSTLATPAHADFTLNTQIDTSKSITATFNVPSSGTEPGIHGNFYVGPLTGTVGTLSFQMFCVDLFSEITSTDHYSVNIKSLSALTPSPNFGFTPDTDLIARLLTIGTTTTKLQGAALQIAIWDATYAGGQSLSGGTLAPYITNLSDSVTQTALVSQVNTFLATAKSYGGTLGVVTYLQPSSNYGQGMVTISPALIVQSVPEPSGLILASIGLVGCVGLGFRRRMQLKVIA